MIKPPLIKHFLGTGFYSGLSPFAPGTTGSLAALIFIYPLCLYAGSIWLIPFLAFWIAVTLICAPSFEKTYGKDPALMVSDEWAGQCIPFISISFSGELFSDLLILGAGFILFRFFDILKPLGINALQKLGSGFGIVMDDILAGVYALISLKILILLA